MMFIYFYQKLLPQFVNSNQRVAAWRSGGFLAKKFNRRTELEPTTKLSYEALHPPLRQTAVCALHEHAVHTCCKVLKKFKNTNLFQLTATGVNIPEGLPC